MIEEVTNPLETTVEKWSRECLASGFKFLRKVDKNYSMTECLTCGHVDTYVQSAIRNGKVRCENCKITQWTRECLANGLKFLKKVDNSNSLTECLTCGHVDTYDQGAIRKGEARCENCKIAQWSRECLANGFKFLKKVDKQYTMTECLTCNHIDTFRQAHIRDGKVRCENCLVNKYKSITKQGWQYVDKTRIKNKTYIILTHHCSDNLVTVHTSHFLDNSYDCPHCSKTHFDEQSNFYVIKVSHNNSQLIKVGVANNTDRRFGQYGLPDDAVIEIIHVKPFETKRLAIAFESMVKESLKEYKLDDEEAKETFTIGGFTECFTDDSLHVIRQLI